MNISVYKNVFLRTSLTKKSKGDIWFIHGFGESGLSFIEAFDSSLPKDFNLYIPDLPGFGATPLPRGNLDQKKVMEIIHTLILELSGNRPLFLVGHSQGGLIATWLCQKLGNRVKAYINIEGSLTKYDITFSREASKKNSASECKTHILNFIREHAKNEESYWRYYASLIFATQDSLLTWARAGIDFIGNTKSGEEYVALEIPKLYLWGAKSCPEQTRDFLNTERLDQYCFNNSDHWPMIDENEEFYDLVHNFFNHHGR